MTQALTAVPAAPTTAPRSAAAGGSYHRLQRQCACGAAKSAAQAECEGCKARKVRGLQMRLAVGGSHDAFEREADAVGAQVMGATDAGAARRAPLSIQRVGPAERDSGAEAPPVVDEVLRSPGQSLDAAARRFFEPRFGYDFGQVRVHHDAIAARSAQAVAAQAYTVGSHVVFDGGRYAPDTAHGRALLAHELTHVVQQRGASAPPTAGVLRIDSPDSAFERQAQAAARSLGGGSKAIAPVAAAPPRAATAILSRADPTAVTVVDALGQAARTGLTFWPRTVVDTQVGPVSIGGGLLNAQAARLNAVVAENLTPMALAQQLLPLWTTATPFTPPGAAGPLPLDVIDATTLAQGLLVYNQTYLRLPAMPGWQAGLRVPLPVEIDTATGMATVNPSIIRSMAGAFDPAWAPLLTRRAAATAAPNAATLHADVAAFLAQETSATGRGMGLGARAVTNALAEGPFIHEAFSQLGAAAFDVALEMLDSMVQRQIDLLAAQTAGAGILTDVRRGLALAPAAPTADQQARITRANGMLGRVAGTVAQAQPAAARTRAERTITVDTVKLDGSTRNPVADVTTASAIFAQCNVRLVHAVDATVNAADTRAWLGGDTDLRAADSCTAAGPEELTMTRRATAQFGLGARLKAFYPATFSGKPAGVDGFSNPGFCAGGARAPLRNSVVMGNAAGTDVFAHELGHVLLNDGHHLGSNLMNASSTAQDVALDNPQCTRLYNNV
jgi:hypothetical protein